MAPSLDENGIGFEVQEAMISQSQVSRYDDFNPFPHGSQEISAQNRRELEQGEPVAATRCMHTGASR